jgi:transposase InsO family protein
MPACLHDHRDLTATIGSLHVQLREQRREVQRLRVENEVLREAAEPLIHHAPARERFAFVDRLRGRFGIRRLCRILATDHSNYHAWVRANARRDERTLDDQELVAWIVEIHTTRAAYGAERVTREFKRQGVEVGRRRVARLMREHGIAGITRRKRRSLTKPDAAAAAVPDLLRREFTAPMPGLKLVGDISSFPTGEGWLYLATVLDLCSKELIGYAIAPHMRASLVVDAVSAAHRAGLVAGNAIMHTDRGGQYHARAYRNTLKRLEIRQSTSRTGSCLDGAAAESFFATVKTEIGIRSWPDRASARRDIENWITHYNYRRLHSALGYRTPAETRIAWQQRMFAAA